MRKPLVTIGVSIFNCRKYLPLLFQSIFTQSFEDWEVVAIDDGSTDGTGEELGRYQDERLRVFVDSENLGLGARLNQVTEYARGAFIARIDADDLLHPLRLARQLELLIANPHVDACVTGSYCIDDHNRLVGVRNIPELARTRRQVLKRNGPLHPTLTAKRSWFQKFPYSPSPRRGQDLDLWFRCIEETALVELRQPLHFIREPRNFDLGKYKRSMKDHRQIFRKMGPARIGPLATGKLVMKSLLKEAVYSVAVSCGLDKQLAGRRNKPVSDSEARVVQEWIDQLQATTRSHANGTYLAEPTILYPANSAVLR